MTRRRTKRQDYYPPPDRMRDELQEIKRLVAKADTIIEAYQMAYDLGLDPRSGASEAPVLSSANDYVAEAAADFEDEDGTRRKLTARYRGVCKKLYGKVLASRENLGNALADCVGGIMGEAAVQPEKVGRGAIITQQQLDEAIARKRDVTEQIKELRR